MFLFFAGIVVFLRNVYLMISLVLSWVTWVASLFTRRRTQGSIE